MQNIINRILKETRKKHIDWDKVDSLIEDIGERINDYDGYETILSELYGYHYNSGAVNLELTKIFLKYGFDVTANNGKNGARCLSSLCWSSYDKYVLDIAEMLLKVGADSTISDEDFEDDGKGVLHSIGWRSGDWNLGNYESANIFEAYYEMVSREQSGKEYVGIRAFRDAVGEVVSKIEWITLLDSEDNIEKKYLLIKCGKKDLIINNYIESYIHPYVRNEARNVEDVSDDYSDIVGAKIKGLRFFTPSLAKLSLDNGLSLLMGINSEFSIDEPGVWIRIVSNENNIKLEECKINEIVIHDNKTYRHTPGVYEFKSIILRTSNGAYAMYTHSHKYAVSSIRIEKMDETLIANMKKILPVHNVCLNHVEYAGKAIRWLHLKCDEGNLYITTNGFDEVEVFLSAEEVEVPSKVNKYSNSLKRLSV